MKSDFSVGANSFALKIRHGFTEDSLKPSSNFISGKTVVEPIINIGVHIVRMNSHLQIKPTPKQTTCRCEFIRTAELRKLKWLNFGASVYIYVSVRMNSHLHIKPNPKQITCRFKFIRTAEQRKLKKLIFGASGYGGGMINAFIIGEIVYLAENIKKLALII